MKDPQKSRGRKSVSQLWQKIRVLCSIQRCFRSLYNDIQLYGASCPFYTLRTPLTRYSEVKTVRDSQCTLSTKSLLRQVWSAVMYAALLWSVTVSVFISAFLDIRTAPWIFIEELFALLCVADICVTVLSTYKNSSHVTVATVKEIVRHYCLLRFSNSETFLHCLQAALLIRTLKLTKDTYQVRWVKRVFSRVNQTSTQALKTLFSNVLLFHVLACVWFYSSKLASSWEDTWIVRGYLEDAHVFEQYIASLYFVVTTLATVGTGDITAYTVPERICALGLMAFGVAFYSSIISTVAFCLADSPKDTLSKQLLVMDNFTKAVKLPPALHSKVTKQITFSHSRSQVNWQKYNQLLADVPLFLSSELSLYIYQTLVSQVRLLQDKSPALVADLAGRLKGLNMNEQQEIYQEGSLGGELFFLINGRVELRRQEVKFLTYVKGSYFGELEVLWGWRRTDSAWTKERAELMVLDKSDFLFILNRYAEFRREILEIALIRKSRNEKAFKRARGFSQGLSPLEAPTSHKTELRKLLTRENNRTKWQVIRLQGGRQDSRELTSQPLVSAQQSFALSAARASENALKRKKRKIQTFRSNFELSQYSDFANLNIEALEQQLEALEWTQRGLREGW